MSLSVDLHNFHMYSERVGVQMQRQILAPEGAAEYPLICLRIPKRYRQLCLRTSGLIMAYFIDGQMFLLNTCFCRYIFVKRINQMDALKDIFGNIFHCQAFKLHNIGLMKIYGFLG